MITQLFGKKKYHYKLQLQEPAPTTIFKERNINISVNLVDMNNEKIMNCKSFSIQPTSSIFAWEFVMLMENGLQKIGWVKTLWKEKQKWRCIMEKDPSLRCTQEMSAEAILKEKSTLSSIPRPQCSSFQVTPRLLKKWWIATW